VSNLGIDAKKTREKQVRFELTEEDDEDQSPQKAAEDRTFDDIIW
jgi:hypothetical protein